jgi:hypothetical protein
MVFLNTLAYWLKSAVGPTGFAHHHVREATMAPAEPEPLPAAHATFRMDLPIQTQLSA